MSEGGRLSKLVWRTTTIDGVVWHDLIDPEVVGVDLENVDEDTWQVTYREAVTGERSVEASSWLVMYGWGRKKDVLMPKSEVSEEQLRKNLELEYLLTGREEYD